LLVAEVTVSGTPAITAGVTTDPYGADRRWPDLGSIPRDTEKRATLVPVHGLEAISMVRLALVTSVTCTPPFDAAGEVPQQPAVHIAEDRVPAFGSGAAPSTLSGSTGGLPPEK